MQKAKIESNPLAFIGETEVKVGDALFAYQKKLNRWYSFTIGSILADGFSARGEYRKYTVYGNEIRLESTLNVGGTFICDDWVFSLLHPKG